MQCGVVNTIIVQLEEIEHLFRMQRQFRFFDSSVLLTYDAKDLATFLEEHESKLSSEGIAQCRGGIPVKVCMIDFGKVVPLSLIHISEPTRPY